MEFSEKKLDGSESRARPRKGRGHMRSAQAKRDDDIMNTNDSSIVSKRSVSKLYFPDEPDFYEPFVQKFVRRNPLINRGYWLRMHAIEQVVLRFLNEDPHVTKVVVNLGCGYDPLPFQFWHRYASSCQNATFVDVDYPQLIERKRDRILMNALTREALLKSSVRSSGAPIYLRSDRYMALGCDLKDLKTLERVLRSEFDMTSTAVIFVAEVSITYMPLADAQSLIEWARRFSNSQFCLLEQYLPQGPDHPFARTMLKHFNKLQTPIQAVRDYPSLALQQSRFTQYGWSISTMQSLWDLWSDDTFTSPELRRRLDAVEPFDEWEEFALFAGHYFLLVASNKIPESSTCEKEARKQPEAQVEPGDLEVSNSTESILLTAGSDVTVTPRRLAAAFSLRPDTIGLHGGQGVQHRLASIDVLGHEKPDRSDSGAVIPPLPSPQARICHTITSIKNNTALLVGGRTSPSHALSECWYLHDRKWELVEELHPARFRHAAVGVNVSLSGPETEGEVVSGVYIFGGKTREGHILDDSVIWLPNQGWQSLPVVGNVRPTARFGAAICTPGAKSWGLLMGGMTSDGTVLDDVWEFRILATPSLQIQFTDRTRDIRHSTPRRKAHARFGASLVPFGNDMLLVGGIASKELLPLSEDFLLVSAMGTKIHIEAPKLSVPRDTWPLLVGAGVIAVSDDEVVIAGGGAVCFSMGSFWNRGYISITKAGNQQPSPWSVLAIEDIPAMVEGFTKPSVKPKTQGRRPKSKGKGKNSKGESVDRVKPTTKPRETTVQRVQIQSAEGFSRLVKESKPAIIEKLDLGPCVNLWTLPYLEEKLGADREIVIHDSSSPRMTFASKNFTYEKTTVSAFLKGIANGAKTYLRAVSAAQPNKLPTKLEDDFPSIAQDFQLPKMLAEIIGDTYHSSPLRVSGPVSLWLHYDVLANVLCQIQGNKTLRLYPPSDVRYLGYPPGGSSSNIDVLDPSTNGLQNTHPHVAHLRAGDVLFIPPMWSHTATPEEGHSVAVNVFFRDLEKGYAAGKDVYGNRDLQAYETGRRDVEKIVRAFRDVPSDLAKFYLERLAGEILEKAEALGKGKE
ncbi:leucine carboxyl methyltransferase 2 [Westerdykella ornata]|uniref:tRNA wybutosine-synthesizing protein 4 n=1 Tax=Westerdykella ornata TaxID=318751 RepID=A0A6A6JC53_WESOR|nr:leucine carboxyl methyltransferase 2 [Westerdykella ornata]KAF2273578.1 leucine carboxyl methyltransferase 2 [Westerdykella ornata]